MNPFKRYFQAIDFALKPKSQMDKTKFEQRAIALFSPSNEKSRLTM